MSTEGLRIGFERSGGYTGIPMTADVRTRDLPPDQASELERLVEQAGLDRFAGSSAGPGQPDRFTYRLRVERDGGEHEVWLGESDLDERTRPLVEWLSAATRPPAHEEARRVNTPAELRVDPDYGNRGGYSANALGIEVPLPIADELADDLVTYGDGQTVLPYEHFSLVMSRSRRLAVYTAVNLDGERTVDTGPRKHDNWVLDKRLPDNVQIDSFLYDRTPFDKGHLVRRLDPVWGETRDEALRAEADTFHYTNCSPQHEKFNRSKELWQGIENYILDNTDLFHLRVCLFNGPVFAPDDPTVKDVPIPREYWKVVTIRKADGSLSATAYLLSQAELLQEMLVPDFEFGAYRTFQVLVSDIEEKTRLSFGELREHDPKRGAEGVLAVEPIELADFSDIVL